MSRLEIKNSRKEAEEILALSSVKGDENEYFKCEEKLPFD